MVHDAGFLLRQRYQACEDQDNEGTHKFPTDNTLTPGRKFTADNNRLVMHWKIHRPGQGAHGMRPMVNFAGVRGPGEICDGHDWAERYSGELSGAVLILRHEPDGVVRIIRDDDTGVRAQMQYPKHMTGRQRGHQQFLRIVAGGVAPEKRTGRAGDGRLFLWARHFVVTAVGLVVTGSRAKVAGPFRRYLVPMFF